MAIEQSNLIGGNLCLDFMNTVGNHLAAEPGEHLTEYRELALWGAHAKAISPDEAERLIALADDQPERAARALERAVRLRDVVYRLLLAHIREQTPDGDDLAAFNDMLSQMPARIALDYHADHYHWRTAEQGDPLDAVLVQVVWSAADLLASDQLALVKLCAGDECGWVFLDTSRNHARRWCSMDDCGNRAKAKRHYERHKGD